MIYSGQHLGVDAGLGWSPRIHTEFLVLRATQDTAITIKNFLYGIITLYDVTFQTPSSSLL